MSKAELEQLTRRFFGSYADGDRDATAQCLAEDVVAWITNADAGVDRVEGRDVYMERVPDLQAAGGSVELTQVVPIDDERVMSMVEIRAKRKGKELHNFAGFLARVADGEIAELWMVDAKPAYSDEFWS